MGHEIENSGSERPRRHPPLHRRVPAQIVFNLLEDFDDVPIYDQNVVSYLSSTVPYTE
jgi:hypothetical protein